MENPLAFCLIYWSLTLARFQSCGVLHNEFVEAITSFEFNNTPKPMDWNRKNTNLREGEEKDERNKIAGDFVEYLSAVDQNSYYLKH